MSLDAGEVVASMETVPVSQYWLRSTLPLNSRWIASNRVDTIITLIIFVAIAPPPERIVIEKKQRGKGKHQQHLQQYHPNKSALANRTLRVKVPYHGTYQQQHSHKCNKHKEGSDAACYKFRHEYLHPFSAAGERILHRSVSELGGDEDSINTPARIKIRSPWGTNCVMAQTPLVRFEIASNS